MKKHLFKICLLLIVVAFLAASCSPQHKLKRKYNTEDCDCGKDKRKNR